MQTAVGWSGLLAMMLIIVGCGGAATESGNVATESASEGPQQLNSFDSELWLDQEWVGDLDGMVERGVVRVLVAYSMGQYFLDGAAQRGITYEALHRVLLAKDHRDLDLLPTKCCGNLQADVPGTHEQHVLHAF